MARRFLGIGLTIFGVAGVSADSALAQSAMQLLFEAGKPAVSAARDLVALPVSSSTHGGRRAGRPKHDNVSDVRIEKVAGPAEEIHCTAESALDGRTWAAVNDRLAAGKFEPLEWYALKSRPEKRGSFRVGPLRLHVRPGKKATSLRFVLARKRAGSAAIPRHEISMREQFVEVIGVAIVRGRAPTAFVHFNVRTSPKKGIKDAATGERSSWLRVPLAPLAKLRQR